LIRWRELVGGVGLEDVGKRALVVGWGQMG